MAVWAGSHSSWERAGRSRLDFLESQARSMACTWTHTPTQSCLYIWRSHLCPAGLLNLDICNYISLKEGVAISVTAHINHKYPACMHLWIIRKVNRHFFLHKNAIPLWLRSWLSPWLGVNWFVWVTVRSVSLVNIGQLNNIHTENVTYLLTVWFWSHSFKQLTSSYLYFDVKSGQWEKKKLVQTPQIFVFLAKECTCKFIAKARGNKNQFNKCGRHWMKIFKRVLVDL